MATDAFVKFGESTQKGGPLNTPLPAISGDSDDATHYWWCELRDCSFDLENVTQDKSADQGSSSSGSKTDDQQSGFKKVTLRKRIDWATPNLFNKCCEAAKAKDKKTKTAAGTDDPGKIDIITVDICRPGGDAKIPFVTVRYYDVIVTDFRIEISGPEPAESITFKFSAVEFEYTQTDPYSNLPVSGQPKKTTRLENNASKDSSPGSDGGGQTGSSDAANGSPNSTPAGPAHVVAPASPNNAHPGAQSATDQNAQTLFHGYVVGTGPGVQQ
jgi:type VI protein secretion system component Hcp